MTTRRSRGDTPEEVSVILQTLEEALNAVDSEGRRIGNAQFGSSAFGAVLNEVAVSPTERIDLPESFRFRIVPEPVYSRRVHPDLRIARRASTIAKLAEVISQRAVQHGLRTTLLTQARRLERLTQRRLEDLTGDSAHRTR